MMFVPAQAYAQQFLSTFKEFPPSQAVGSLSVEKVLQPITTFDNSKRYKLLSINL